MKKITNYLIPLVYLYTFIEAPLYFALKGSDSVTNSNLSLTLLTACTIFSILCLPKTIKAISKISFSFDYKISVLKAISCFTGVLLLAHLIACGWLRLRGLENLDLTSAYIRSYYWSITSLTTVGYGDIVPKQNAEYLYATFVMILGIAMYAVIIGNIANLLAQRDHTRIAYQEKIEKLKSYLKYHQIPQKMQQRIWDYYQYTWINRIGSDGFKPITDLPEPLRTDIALHLAGDLIRASEFFKDGSPELLRFLAPRLNARLNLPGDIIIRESEPGEEMFFIAEGAVEVIKSDKIINTLKSGDYFGEMSLLNSSSIRNASIRAITVVESFSLHKVDFNLALKYFPDFDMHIKTVALSRLNFESKKVGNN